MVVIYRNRRCTIESTSNGNLILKAVRSVKGKVKTFEASLSEELLYVRGLIVSNDGVLRVS